MKERKICVNGESRVLNHPLMDGMIFNKRAEAEKQELQRRKEIADEMFEGMARLVDRFAICDLDTDHYEHHERKKKIFTRRKAPFGSCGKRSPASMLP